MNAGTGLAASLPSLAVVVVAADSGPLLEPCMGAVLASPLPSVVHLFDNASRDGMPQRVAARHAADGRFQCTHSPRNLGFGAAVNRAAEDINCDWLLILNPDAMLTPPALARLMACAAEHAEAGLVGAVMVDEAGVPDPASRRRDPLLRRVLAQFGLRRAETVDVTGPFPDTVLEVEAVSGALMLVRRELFARLGGFDAAYFLHFEDLDLCRRVRDAGFQVLLDGGLRVVHRQGSSSHHRPIFVAWHKHRGMWRWFRQHDPAARSVSARLLMRSAIGAHFLLALPRLLWRACWSHHKPS